MRFHLIEWLLGILLLSSLYLHANIGGTGFRLPSNIVVWLMGAMIGFYSLYHLTLLKVFYLPRNYLLILFFPTIVLFSGSLSGFEISEVWLFRLLYLWGGGLFLFGLFQYNFKQGRIDRLLLMIVLLGFIHACVGLLQIFPINNLPSWLPKNPSAIPTGIFQHINNQASFQVTTIILTLWLLTRPIIRYGRPWYFGLLLVALVCATFITSYSGSRVGALALLIALPLFVLGRWEFIKKENKRSMLIFFVFILSLLSANLLEKQRGHQSILDKTMAMNAGFSGSARLGIYSIAIELIKEKPILGHGIGSFVEVWQRGKVDFYTKYPEATLPSQRVSHPHNEMIMWMVEGGSLAGMGLLLVVMSVLLSLKRLPHGRRYAYAAILVPITLHTQVELPFYISSIHWFVFLILLFLVLQPSRKKHFIRISVTAKKLLRFTAISGAALTTFFMSHTMAANLEFKQYITQNAPNENPFPIAMKNLYFKNLAIHQTMTSLFSISMRYGIENNIKIYADWGEQELKHNPHIVFYRTTVEAYLYLKQQEKACDLAHEGWQVYPSDLTLQKFVNHC